MMTDSFALLGQARSPWLDPDQLSEAFRTRSLTLHPDRIHELSSAQKESASHRYAELNAAYQCLREPRERLAHLLELEQGRRPDTLQSAPAEATELFFTVGQLCREVDQFLSERSRIESPLLKARSFEKSLALTQCVRQFQESLAAQAGQLDAELRTLNDAWAAAPPVGSTSRLRQLPLARLEQLYRACSFLSRWRSQLQERFVQLSM